MFEQLREVIDTYGKEHYLSGNILISKNGQELFCKSYGQASIQLGVPNTLDTRFHIASVTKMFIAAAVLKLYEEGQIRLDDHPGKYVDAFKNLHPGIQIHHLLSHSSGLHDIYALPDLRLEMGRLNAEEGDFASFLARMNQNFEPGERWEYSSTGFIMMGYILQKVTGMKYGEVFDKWFFTPLSMRSTGPDNPRHINPGRAYGYCEDNGQLINADHDKLSEVDAPGEFYSTVRDLDTWCEALFKGRVLKQETMDKMFTPYYVTTIDPHLKYGYGWFLGSNLRSIGGGTPGFRSEIMYDSAHDLRLIMLWNYEKVDSYALSNKLRPILN